MIRFLEASVRGVSVATYSIGAVMIILMMAHITVHVIAQYVFGFPLPGTILFISHYYMVSVTFLCLAAVDLKDGHISVDLLAVRLSARVRNICAAFAFLLTALVFALITWQSFVVAEGRRAAGTFAMEYGFKVLLWPSYYIVPFGAAFFTFTSLTRFVFLVSGRSARFAPPAAGSLKESP